MGENGGCEEVDGCGEEVGGGENGGGENGGGERGLIVVVVMSVLTMAQCDEASDPQL